MASSGGGVRIIANDGRFRSELNNAASSLVVANFTASWCGPCQTIAPKFQQLSLKYTAAIFLEVDVDVCKDTSNQYNVTGTPTFIFFRSGIKLEQTTGADVNVLENRIKKWVGDEGGSDKNIPKGYIDLTPLINKAHSECLNESDEHLFKNVFQPGNSLYLQSDCDEQLLISISFNQPVKLHSMKLYAPDDGHAPKSIKLFVNQTKTLGFDEAENTKCVQELTLNLDDMTKESIIPLKFVKLQYVQSVTLFVHDNQDDEDTTIINSLSFIGIPVASTNMNEFKRVAGKEGEAHG